MPCCGSPALSYTPSFAHQPKAELTVGATGLVLGRYMGSSDLPQFGQVTGAYYPFQAQSEMYVDVRDLPFLQEVIRVE